MGKSAVALSACTDIGVSPSDSVEYNDVQCE